jgi:hypothetical protein
MKTILILLVSMIFIDTNSGTILPKPILICALVKDVRIGDYELFVKALGKRESNNQYDNGNNMPFWGYYQIGPTVRETLNVKIGWKQFKADSTYQDYLMYQNLKFNEKRIKQSYFNYFVGKKIKGIVITYSGILAGAHLAGGGGVRRFLSTNGKYNPSDAFGTRLSDYINEFGGYQFNLSKVNIEYNNGNNSNKTSIQVQRSITD